jgi:O-antigen ligase
MLSQRVRQLLEPHGLPFRLVVVGSVGLLLGVASLRASPLLVLGGLAAVFLVLAVVKRPEIALLGLIIGTSTIVPEESLPVILSVGPGRLFITDFLLLMPLGLIILRWLVEPDFKIVRTPLDLPILAFYGVALLSTLIALIRSLPLSATINTILQTPPPRISFAIPVVRAVSYYLTFFVVTNLVREERQLSLLLRGLFLLAVIVAGAMVVQYLLGPSVPILPGRVETLDTEGAVFSGITRIIPPGESLVLVIFLTTTITLLLDGFGSANILRFLLCGLLGLALILTFKRNFWIDVGLALLILAYLVRGQGRQRMVGVGLLTAFVAAIILLPILGSPGSQAAGLAGASLDRLASLTSSKTFEDQQSSLRSRDLEYSYALPQIASHPLIGQGLGATRAGSGWIHNGHVWIALESGLFGYLCMAWLSLVCLLRGFKHWRRISDRKLRGSVLGFTLAYLGVVVSSMVSPLLVETNWTPVIGIMMGVNEVVFKKLDRASEG